MSRANIAIFVPHVGCPHSCAFCDQRTITGETDIPRAADVARICEQALREAKYPQESEIAFFGGSFTAIDRGYMTELLQAAKPFVGDGGFKGIRISTRPDCIDEEILGLLGEYGVTAIELGAQSMSDKVLEANERGHTAQDAEKASAMIKAHGFELGLQMMIGLYKSEISDERKTIERISALKPDTARIYPVAVLKGTRLAELYKSGEYTLFDFETAVGLACEAMMRFENDGIRVIKLGLHSSELVQSKLVGGFYHPAFRELCESRYYRNCIEKHAPQNGELTVYVSKGSVSAAAGHKKSNKLYFSKKGITLIVKEAPNLEKREIRIDKDVYHVFKIT